VAQQRLGELHSAVDWNMLEDDIRIDQIEHSMEIREPIIGPNEFDIPDAFPGNDFRSFFQHGWRNVDSNRTAHPPRQRHDQTAHVTPEIRGPIGPKVQIQMPTYRIEHARNIQLAAPEELSFASVDSSGSLNSGQLTTPSTAMICTISPNAYP
jgi:hypothetical protein